jgi:hypothetical protein
MRSSVVVLLALMTSLFSCGRPIPFEVHAAYRSLADPARRYEVDTHGSYPEGVDMAEDYRATLSILVGEERHRIKISAKRFTPLLERIESSKHISYIPAQPVDPLLLGRLIESLDPAATHDQVAAEANDLFAVMQAAGMGPKIGLPKTRALLLVSVSNTYR